MGYLLWDGTLLILIIKIFRKLGPMAFCFLFILSCKMTPWETLKIAFGNYPYWHPYSASFAGFVLELDQLLGELGFFLFLPLHLVTVDLVAHWQLDCLGLLLCQREKFAVQVCDLLFLSTDTLLVPYQVAIL